jgi:hypothetical protein
MTADHPIIAAVERELLDVQLRRVCTAQRAKQHFRFRAWRTRLAALQEKVIASYADRPADELVQEVSL